MLKKLPGLQSVLKQLCMNLTLGITNYKLSQCLNYLTGLPIWYTKVKFNKKSKYDVKIKKKKNIH